MYVVCMHSPEQGAVTLTKGAVGGGRQIHSQIATASHKIFSYHPHKLVNCDMTYAPAAHCLSVIHILSLRARLFQFAIRKTYLNAFVFAACLSESGRLSFTFFFSIWHCFV